MTTDQDKLFRSFLDSKDKQFTAIARTIDDKINEVHKRLFAFENRLENLKNQLHNDKLQFDDKLNSMRTRIIALEKHPKSVEHHIGMI